MGLFSNFFKFKKQNKNLFSLNSDKIIESLPGHVYIIDKNEIILGCNKKQAESLGRSVQEVIGKSVKEVLPIDIFNYPLEVNTNIFKTGQEFEGEEDLIFPNGEKQRYFSKKVPVKDENGEIVAILGVSFNLTDILMSLNQTSALFDTILQVIPVSVFWRDKKCFYLGCNDQQAKMLGLKSRFDIIGKTSFDICEIIEPNNPNNKLNAEIVDKVDQEIMATGIPQKIEEKYISKSGEIFYYYSQKLPLRDKQNEIIGLVGVSIDITRQKEAEQLKIENEIHKNALHEQEKFKTIAYQVAHDIRSPVASLLMLVKSCQEIPEAERIALREAVTSIGDIANNLLNKYQNKETDVLSEKVEEREPILVSALLLQLLTDKKYQYQELAIKFEHVFSQKGNFAFIKIEPTALKRTISNIVNNAVDAFVNKEGKIIIKLDATKEWVKIIIQDNGKGMSSELVDKIMKNVAVTQGKKGGHGIGLTQVRETLERNQGELKIDSKVGKGTKVVLTFPRIKAPAWICEEIKLGSQDIVVILDDDTSIHGAWNAHFESVLAANPGIQLRHFELGKDALNFINGLAAADKRKVLLLTDYELLKQELNGLHVVEQGQVERSILVTSHYANASVRDHAAKTGTKILPKQLASEIPITVDASIKYEVLDQNNLKKVDLVLVDDDQNFAESMMISVFLNLAVDHYADPRHFLQNVSKYSKDTKICLDNNFATGGLHGLDIAEQLHEQGYTRLYILSGEVFDKNKIPSYLTVVRKDDIESIKNL